MLPTGNPDPNHAANAGPQGPEPGKAPGGTDPARILIVLPRWVGDVVMAIPALQAMRERHAQAHITYLLKSHLADILSGGRWMDEVLCWPSKNEDREKQRQGFLGFSAQLRDRQFDCAILMANSFRSALLVRLAGIRRRVGYDRDGRGLLLTDKLLTAKNNGRYLPMPMIRYYNALARYMGCRDCAGLPVLYTSPEDEAAAAAVLAAAAVRPDQPIIVLNPGASYGPAKCWPPERFAGVADRLIERHDAAVLISCGPGETSIARQVAAGMKRPAVVLDSPILKLGPTKALIRRCRLLITNDTGPRHFAIALGTPVVTIFGPTDARWTANEYPYERRVQVKIDCAPCMKRTCPLDHQNCMTWISSEMVLEQANALLAERPAATA